MRIVRLGRTGLVVSRVGFGGIPIQRPTEAEAVRVVRRCLELGVSFLDTGNAYTTSEERIGKALAASGLSREQFVIATKTAARDRATAWEHLELSLQRLEVDAIDLWQMHNVSTFEVYEQVLGPGGALEAAQQALEEGKVRHVGITSHSLDVALEAVPSGLFETVQFPFNFVTNEPADSLVPLALKHDVGFIAMKPFGGGMLADARLAIKYLLHFDHVVPDPGIERVEEIEEIVAILDGPWDLAPAEWKEISRIRQAVGVRFCRRCGYCEPCPQGVRISLVMNIPNILRRMSVEWLTTGNQTAALLSGRDCIECGECEEKCPYMLPIREMLREHMELYEGLLK